MGTNILEETATYFHNIRW